MRAPADASPLLKKAYSRMGQRYVYGANDCSGFVMSVYRTQGVSLPHSSRAQSGLGRRVPKGELQPGDLVFFKTNRGTRVNHVGIYTGGGKFIHASSGGGKVQRLLQQALCRCSKSAEGKCEKQEIGSPIGDLASPRLAGAGLPFEALLGHNTASLGPVV
jgi:hypothetical protein